MQVEATALQRLWRSHSLGSCISASVVVSSPSSTRRHCSCISDVTSKLSYGQRLQHFSLRRSNQRSKITEKSTSEEAAQRTVYSVARRISAVLRGSPDVPVLAELSENQRSGWAESEHHPQTHSVTRKTWAARDRADNGDDERWMQAQRQSALHHPTDSSGAPAGLWPADAEAG